MGAGIRIGPAPAGRPRSPGAGGPYLPPGAVPTAPAGQSGPAPRAKLEPAKLFGLVIAALGALNFAFGFLPQVTASRLDESLSVYAVGPGYVPILLLIAGLLALGVVLPGSERSRLAVAAVSVGGAVGALISLGTTGPVEMLTTAQVSKGLGAVLLTIFGIIQAVVAIAAYVVGADFGARSGQAVVTVARDPATGAVWSTPWSAAAHPAAPAPGPPPPGSVGYYAGYAPPRESHRRRAGRIRLGAAGRRRPAHRPATGRRPERRSGRPLPAGAGRTRTAARCAGGAGQTGGPDHAGTRGRVGSDRGLRSRRARRRRTSPAGPDRPVLIGRGGRPMSSGRRDGRSSIVRVEKEHPCP